MDREERARGGALRSVINDLADQLCLAVDGRFDFTVHPAVADETVEKLGMLINFVLDAARRALSELEARNAALAELDRMKSDFLANVSHELRTPLTLILGPVDSLLGSGVAVLPAAARDNLERVRRNALRLSALVDDLLEFSRLEAGKLQPCWQPVQIMALVQGVVEDARPAAEARGLDLSFTAQTDPGFVPLDRRLFEKIVLNLIANALKFTPTGGRVEVSLRPVGDELEVAVADSGVGIPAEKLPLLFQRFQQVDASATRKYEGTGLGLALVREFAELMAGRAGVESEPGRGSRFWVRIPRSAERLPDPGSTDALAAVGEDSVPVASRRFLQVSHRVSETPGSPAALSGAAGKPRLLIAEDNPDMRAYLTELLAPEYEVAAVENGRKALEAASTVLPDIILSDVMMPEMDGMELVAHLKGDPDLRELPVILLTARAGSSAAATGLETGADDYVSKPFTPEELRARVRAAWRLRQFSRERAELLAERARERGRAEALAEESRRKDEFLAMLAHELRNPLAPIRTAARLLRRQEPQDAVIQRNSAVIERQVQNMARLLDDLLDVSQITRGKVKLKREAVDLSAVAANAGETARPLIEGRQHELVLSLAPEPLPLEADRVRLEQVVINLLNNAAKYTDPGGRITVKTFREASEAVLEVCDTGRGIPPELLPHVFELFIQGERDLDRSQGGLGIGLKMVKTLVELHGGSVTAQSPTLECDTQFTVRLPLATAEMSSQEPGQKQ
jgi:signal transduction histidine kinase